jgi:hypothetical protein
MNVSITTLTTLFWVIPFVIFVFASNTQKKAEDIAAIDLAQSSHLSRSDVIKHFGRMNLGHIVGKTYQMRFLLEKVKANSELKEALLLAQEKHVTVCVSDFFDVEPGWVYVDYRADDRQIIDFLL